MQVGARIDGLAFDGDTIGVDAEILLFGRCQIGQIKPSGVAVRKSLLNVR